MAKILIVSWEMTKILTDNWEFSTPITTFLKPKKLHEILLDISYEPFLLYNLQF